VTGEKLPNREKQARYARAHERLKLAHEQGFYIEAAAICESMISDRLHSHLHWRVEVAQLCTMEDVVARLAQKRMFKPPADPPEISLTKSATLFILIMAMRLDFKDHGFEKYQKLPNDLEIWRLLRNEVAHNLAYTLPNKKQYRKDFEMFMESAKECSEKGQQLVYHLSNWDSLVRRRHIKALKDAGG
jgi:hypothetical protein